MPSFTAEAALYRSWVHHAGSALPAGTTDRQAAMPQAPPEPWRKPPRYQPYDRCTYGPCLPKINCVDYGGGIYDCWVESYKRLRCCPTTILGGEPCHYTTAGCPPGGDIQP